MARQGPPVDGMEYLRRVRWEAARCPAVVRADIDPRQFDRRAAACVRVCAGVCVPVRAHARCPAVADACLHTPRAQQAHELRAAAAGL